MPNSFKTIRGKIIISSDVGNIGYNFPLSIKNNFLTCCRLLIFNIIYLSFISVVKSFGFPELAKIPCVLLLLAIAVMPTLVASDYSICHNAIFLKIFQFFALARTGLIPVFSIFSCKNLSDWSIFFIVQRLTWSAAVSAVTTPLLWWQFFLNLFHRISCNSIDR